MTPEIHLFIGPLGKGSRTESQQTPSEGRLLQEVTTRAA